MVKQGLFNKYTVTKTDGSPVDPDAQYFVLRIDTDYAARVAVLAYANSIQVDNPQFAEQLRRWVIEYHPRKLTEK